MTERNFQLIETNGIRLRTVVEGTGPLVILLHGFPQCWYLWRHQIGPLVEAGFQVAVPDQRGYGGSDRPEAIEAYNIVELTKDVVGIADALDHERFVVVGHDWGAPVAWHTALLHAERVRAVVGMSVPYVRGQVGVMTRQENFGDNFWYIVYFQQPGVAEAELEADIRKSLRVTYYVASGDAPEGVWFTHKPASAGFPRRPARPDQPAIVADDRRPRLLRGAVSKQAVFGDRSTGIGTSTAILKSPPNWPRPRSNRRHSLSPARKTWCCRLPAAGYSN